MKTIHKLLILLLLIFWPYLLAQPSYIREDTFKLNAKGVVSILNTHTGEFETIKYKNEDGLYLEEGLSEINHILRCRLTNTKTEMSLRLIELIDNIETHFGVDHIKIISGYRSAKLNNNLRSRSRRIARDSLHTKGLAVDIVIPGVPARKVRDYAKSLAQGGVGYYGRFVHVDVGQIRYW